MLTESIENSAEAVFQKMICESCGEKFSCGAATGNCWCFSLVSTPEKLTELRENFEHCLCERCLTGKRNLPE